MNDGLTPHSQQSLATPELRRLMQSAVDRHEAAESDNTRRTYRAGWEQFKSFCEANGLNALPASPSSVTLFIEHLAGEGYAFNTIEARLAAVAARHRESGHRSPCSKEPVRKQKQNVRRTLDTTPEKKAPLLLEHLRRMRFEPQELKDLRDRALLFVGFAGGFRRSELVGLRVRDVREAHGGKVLFLRRSKTDQEGKGRPVHIPNNVALEPTPNEALDQWLSEAGIESGPVFRGVDRWGNVREEALSGQAVYDVVRQRVEAIGEDPDRYSAHSLRAGYATQGYIDRIGEHEIAAQTGHRKLDTLRGYQRVDVVMKDHPLTRMGRE